MGSGFLRRSAVRRFREQGWTRAAILPPATCLEVRRTFLAEVKPWTGPLLRQLTSRAEPHALSVDGYVTNPVANPHRTGFPAFSTVETTVMRACPLVEVVETLLDGPAAMLQSAYYESSRGTLT
ncbi:MAG: hypothetical protein KC656_06220, partial [Myxococcales bacterium]|nr:hypothetical protein [Myxococcales bacterium]